MHLFCTGTASRDQGACILCPCDAPSLRTWRWPASVPLLHHPLTVEGQGGPPLSTGPAALIGPDSKGGGRGDWEGGVGERRGWTRSLLLITDHYPDWMPLICPNRLFSLFFINQRYSSLGLSCGEVWGKRLEWMDFLSLSVLFSPLSVKNDNWLSTTYCLTPLTPLWV